MLFRKETWPGLADGSITRAFRWWKRPTVKPGGTQRTPAGVLAIDALEIIGLTDITEADAVAAGFDGRAALLADLESLDTEGRQLYRIEFHLTGTDARAELREDTDLSADDLADIAARLARFDRDAGSPWTRATLDLIAARPGESARLLAEVLGTERLETKRRIRKLKGLGLTVSLPVGYCLSPRGEAVHTRLTDPARTRSARPRRAAKA